MMETWKSMQKTIDWIEENYSCKVDIAELAKMASLSPFYYQKLFKRYVGRPVMEYVKLRRLAKAADYIEANDDRILDVSLDFGFENHETFTRAFKEAYGMAPMNYRKNPSSLSHFIKPDLSLQYYLIDENVPLIAEGIVLEVTRKELQSPRCFLGLSVQNPMDDTPGVDFLGNLWDEFHELKGSIPGLIYNGNEVGVSTTGEIPGHFTYFAGAEAVIEDAPNKYTLDINSNSRLRKWTMEAGKYIVCSFEAENFYMLVKEALNKALNYMLGTWLAKKDIQTEPFMLEMYYGTSPESGYMEIWFKCIN